MGLSEAYEEDQLFSFDFSQSTRVPRLPEFADWAEPSGDLPTVFFDKAFCQAMVHEVGPQLEGQIPVSRGQGFSGQGGSCILTLIHLYTAVFPFTPAPTSGASGFSPGACPLPPAAEPCPGWVGSEDRAWGRALTQGGGNQPGQW